MDILGIVKTEASSQKVDESLCCAIALTESGADFPRSCCRYEPNWRYWIDPEKYAQLGKITVDTEKMLQACSWGPMQIMGSVARELGFEDPLPLLFDPGVSVRYAVKKVRTLVDRFENELFVISAYNAGTPRKRPDGTFTNEQYVAKVVSSLKRLRGF